MAAQLTYEEATTNLTKGQKEEGYCVETCQDRVLVWYKENQIALLYSSPDIGRKVQ